MPESQVGRNQSPKINSFIEGMEAREAKEVMELWSTHVEGQSGRSWDREICRQRVAGKGLVHCAKGSGLCAGDAEQAKDPGGSSRSQS